VEQKQEHFHCDCHSLTHIARVTVWEDDTFPPEVYFDVAVNHYIPWYKRLPLAIKYLFGIRDMDYTSVALTDESLSRLKAIVEYGIEKNVEYQNKVLTKSE
jgi:hypothetical protein